jgi:hypothetical protein
VAADAPAASVVVPLARPTELEPVVSSKYAEPAPALLDAVAAAATAEKTGRAGEIICPVMICGIWVYLFTRIKWRTSRRSALHE